MKPKARLPTLKPRLQTLNSQRVPTLTANRNATPRQRGRAWMERRAKWLRAHPLCCDCEAEGRVTTADEVDHVVPLWAGGADDESNYRSTCVEHHKQKTAAEAKERAGS